MTYNIHPIFVHFPIALLFLYSLIKIIPFKKWFPNVKWRDIERVLLLVGVLGAFVALGTGGSAAHLAHANRQLVRMHSMFASMATWLYVILLAGEISAYINEKQYFTKFKFISTILIYIEKIFCSPLVSITIALLALVAISLTGLLGGTIVYGVSADPIAPTVLHLLNISL